MSKSMVLAICCLLAVAISKKPGRFIRNMASASLCPTVHKAEEIERRDWTQDL